jgi:hypothetical protein
VLTRKKPADKRKFASWRSSIDNPVDRDEIPEAAVVK